jgi:hypothetical protein
MAREADYPPGTRVARGHQAGTVYGLRRLEDRSQTLLVYVTWDGKGQREAVRASRLRILKQVSQ